MVVDSRRSAARHDRDRAPDAPGGYVATQHANIGYVPSPLRRRATIRSHSLPRTKRTSPRSSVPQNATTVRERRDRARDRARRDVARPIPRMTGSKLGVTRTRRMIAARRVARRSFAARRRERRRSVEFRPLDFAGAFETIFRERDVGGRTASTPPSIRFPSREEHRGRYNGPPSPARCGRNNTITTSFAIGCAGDPLQPASAARSAASGRNHEWKPPLQRRHPLDARYVGISVVRGVGSRLPHDHAGRWSIRHSRKRQLITP